MSRNTKENAERITVGVSACLLGENVRYDGKNKLEPAVVSQLGKVFDLAPFCPEVGIGMPSPREAVDLVWDGEGHRIVGASSGEDYTARMKEYAMAKMDELKSAGASGFVFKKKSPSCGAGGVRRLDAGAAGVVDEKGIGFFAAAVMEAFPFAPVVEEDRLRDAAVTQEFIERVFACRSRMEPARGGPLSGQRERGR